VDIAELVQAAERSEEVRVVVRDGEERRTPIWIVAVGPSVFVRSYRAGQGKWYQHVKASGSFPLEIAGEDVVVTCEPVTDAPTLEDVSAAYRAKYADAPEMPDMVTPEVVATTLRLSPS